MNDLVTPQPSQQLLDLPRCEPPPVSAIIRSSPEDFVVEEIPLIQPDGEGEHLWLLLEKRAENTTDLLHRLNRVCRIKPSAIGYAGRKDKHAIAHQWFSLHLPGREDPSQTHLEQNGFRVLQATRHSRKLKIGALSGNRFRIRLRKVTGNPESVQASLSRIALHGVPNYFGEQRFGHARGNLAKARTMFAGRTERDRHRRSLYLSAARSALFNAILAERVRDNTWNQLLPSETVILDGSRSYFRAELDDAALPARLEAWDIHPSGALWGADNPPSAGQSGDLERAVAGRFADIAAGLATAGLRQERRALRLRPSDFSWRWENGEEALMLDFCLPAGAFATAILREIADYSDMSLNRVDSGG